MIKISRNAWYMNYYMSMHSSRPKNLCQLIRGMLTTTLLWMLVFVIIAVVATMTLYPFWYIVMGGDSGIFALTSGWLGFLIIYVLRENYDDFGLKRWFLTRRLDTPHIVPTTPSFFKILWKYLKAIHDKTCPLIEVK